MSLRPRYSLLTLLLLTALVAGVVKLWYGPHRVVERTAADHEEEYTFTRNWRGERKIQGPYVTRITPAKRLESRYVKIEYYRAGTKLSGSISCMANLRNASLPDVPVEFPQQLELSPGEQADWGQVIAQERKLLASTGLPTIYVWWQ